MKKITLALFAVVCFFGSSFGQLNYNIVAPANNGSTSEFRAPNGTNLHAFQRSAMYISAIELLPMSLSTINSFSFQYTHGTGTTPVVGNLTVWMQNTTDLDYLKGTTWSAITTGMTQVYSGSYTIPAATGAASVPVNFTTNFPYTGGGVYIAWDWVSTGPFSAGTATYACNNTLTQIATADASVTPAPTTLAYSNFRPSLLFHAINTATNDVGVLNITAAGKISKQYGVPQTVTATVLNSSIGAQNNVTVALNVGGANSFSDTKVIPTLAAGALANVVFTSFNSTTSGINTLSVAALFNDQNLTNNLKVWTQSVTCAEAGSVPPAAGSLFSTTNAYGNGTGTGFIYSAKYTPPGNASLTGVRLLIANFTANNVGHPITPVLLDASGAILASGNAVNTTAGMLGNWAVFNFITPQALTANTDYYIGASVTSPTFYPISILNNTYTPYFVSPGFYTSPVAGGSVPTQIGGIDYLGIEAALSFTNNAITASASKTIVCKKDGPNTVTLTAGGLSTYTWTGGSTNTVIVVSPTVTGTGGGVVVYTVTGTDAASGCKGNVASITVSVSLCTGLSSNTSNGYDLRLFPNPSVSGKSTITGLAGTNYITVFNALGQVVLNQMVTEETTSIDLSSQPSGNYLVKITDSNSESRTIKVVNQN